MSWTYRVASGTKRPQTGTPVHEGRITSGGGMPAADSLTEEVARLYALPPDEFVAARNAAAKAWKQAGRKDEAAALGALRKPSVVEGALNRTAHRDPAATR